MRHSRENCFPVLLNPLRRYEVFTPAKGELRFFFGNTYCECGGKIKKTK